MANFTYKYNSLQALAHDVSGEVLKAWGKNSTRKTYGDTSTDNAVNMLTFGDVDSAKIIRACDGIENADAVSHRIQLVNDVKGCIPNIPAYLMGLPKQMLNVRREAVRVPVIDIYVNTTCSWNVTREQIARAGAKVANVVAGVEKKGIRVNLHALVSTKTRPRTRRENDIYIMSVRVKEATEPLNLLNMAFCFVNEDFLRRIFFLHLDTHLKYYTSGRGVVLRDTDILREQLGKGVFFHTQNIIEDETPISGLVEEVNNYLKGAQ